MHFGIIFTHNMEVGLVHPPVGLNLFVLSTISDAPIGEVIRGILPFLVLLLMRAGDDHLLAGDDAVAAGPGVREVAPRAAIAQAASGRAFNQRNSGIRRQRARWSRP